MAEATVFRNNALNYPVYGVAWTVVAPLLDADGDPISPSSPDSERSLNGDTFADCTNEMTEIATSSGVVYLTLTAAEMTADVVAVQLKSTGAKTTVLTLYPRKLPILSTGTCQGSNDTGDIQLASGDSAVDDYYNGCLIVAVIDGTTEARIINDYVGSTKVAEVSPAWNTAQPDSSDTYTIYLPEGRQVVQANATHWNSLATVELPLVPTTAGRKLDVSAGGEAGVDWANVGSPTTTLALTGTTIAVTQKVDVETIKTNPVANGGTVTFPTNATLASTTNITAGTITTATNVTTVNGLAANVITAASIADGAIDRATFAADTGLQTLRSNTAQAGANGSITLDASASAVDDFYKNALVVITGNTGVGQSRTISGYTGTSKVATVTPNWGTNPDNTSTFAILPAGAVAGASAPTAGEVADAVWDEARSGHVTSGSFGEYVPADVQTIKTQSVTCSAGVTVGTFVGQATAAIGVNASGHVSRVVLTDTLTTYTSNTPQTGDSFARIGATGSGLTSLAPSATALSTAQWTSARAGYLDNVNNATLGAASFPTDPADQSLVIAATDAIITALALKATQASVDDLPTNAELATALGTADDAVLVQVALVKAKTDLIPASPAAVGSAMTLADGAITDAKFTLPTEATGTPSTFLQLMMWVAGMLGWRKVIKDGNAGTIVQYMSNGSTVKTTSTFTTVTTTDTLNKAS